MNKTAQKINIAGMNLIKIVKKDLATFKPICITPCKPSTWKRAHEKFMIISYEEINS